jgi:AbrB family looped-hinge helix DNA binding protein
MILWGMADDKITTLTERGQISIPASIRRSANLKPGNKLIWESVSATEFRITLASSEEAPGPMAMLGFAQTFQTGSRRTTDEIMAELRAGDED